MRKNFLFIVLVPLIILLIFLYIFHNQWIESAIEYAAEEIVGAKVEIDNLNVTFSPIGIELSRLQITNPQDPWENLIETDSIKFEMDAGQLLRGKYIIEEVALHNVSIGTKRKTDGSIPKERRDRAILAGDKFTFSGVAESALKNLVTPTPLFDLAKLRNGFNADSLVSILDIKSLKFYDSLKTQVEGASKEWDNIKGDFETAKTKLAGIEEQVKKIDPGNLKNVESITSAILTVDNAIKSVNDISSLVSNRSSSIQNNVSGLTESIGLVDDIVKSDFARLKDMARLPSFNSNGMAQMLVGTEMYKRAHGYLGWIDMARENIPASTTDTEKENPPRLKGQDIPYPTKGYPKFWIKKALITASSEKYIDSSLFKASGLVKNVTDNQKLTGKPLTIELAGKFRELRSLKLNGNFDRMTDIPKDTYIINLSGVPISNFSLGKVDFLPSTISKALMDSELKISVPGNKLDAQVKLHLGDLALSFAGNPKNVAEDIVHRVLTRINDLNISLRLWNTSGSFDVALSTDLDTKIATEIQNILGEELTKLQNELKAKFDAKVMPEINKYKNMIETKLGSITGQLGDYQSLLTENLNLVDNKKKDLETQLEKAKKGFLEDKLKGLFK